MFDPEELCKLVRAFYVALYSEEEHSVYPALRPNFPSLSAGDIQSLNSPLSNLEIETALFQMGPFKAPGPDGLPPGFYQRHWQTVGPSICQFVQNAFKDQSFPAHMNEVLISLIPKVKNPETVSEFRPIALTNVVTKLITKVVANRFKQAIPKLVDQSQCAFTPGRRSSENIIIAQEII